MRLNLLLALALPIAIYSQDSIAVGTNGTYPNTFSSGSDRVEKFDNKARKFTDWSISAGGGTALMTFSDLTSIYDSKIDWGWTAYAGINKQITHTFGIGAQYQSGQTNQNGRLPEPYGSRSGVADAWTKFQTISVYGDLNLSNLLRRVDNQSTFRWSAHAYAGVGILKYSTRLIDNYLSVEQPNMLPITVYQDFGLDSFYYQLGAGLKYKVSRLIDIEARVLYMDSGDDEFDGGGYNRDARDNSYAGYLNYNLINDSYSDKVISATLGLSFNIGKHISNLSWHDPLQEAYSRTAALENASEEFVVCEKGDNDNDGVCDDWDRQLDTPAGARVDGAGVALDLDLDGVIDLLDKCVTVPGPSENQGCPTEAVGQ